MQAGIKNGYVTVGGNLSGAVDSLGNFFPLDSSAVAYAYNASGALASQTATYNGSVWLKTYGYNADGTLANETQWVKQ